MMNWRTFVQQHYILSLHLARRQRLSPPLLQPRGFAAPCSPVCRCATSLRRRCSSRCRASCRTLSPGARATSCSSSTTRCAAGRGCTSWRAGRAHHNTCGCLVPPPTVPFTSPLLPVCLYCAGAARSQRLLARRRHRQGRFHQCVSLANACCCLQCAARELAPPPPPPLLTRSSPPHCARPAVSVLETPSEVADGKRRPKHEALDAVYFMRPTCVHVRTGARGARGARVFFPPSARRRAFAGRTTSSASAPTTRWRWRPTAATFLSAACRACSAALAAWSPSRRGTPAGEAGAETLRG